MSWVMKLVFVCGKEGIKVTHFFNHFKWMWSDVSKVIQNSKLAFLHIVRLHRWRWVELWTLFEWCGEYCPNTAVMENAGDPKFSRPIRLLDSFAENFSRKALSFEFIFCMAVNYHDWNFLNRFRSLMSLKGALLKQVLAIESPLKMMKMMFFISP